MSSSVEEEQQEEQSMIMTAINLKSEMVDAGYTFTWVDDVHQMEVSLDGEIVTTLKGRPEWSRLYKECKHTLHWLVRESWLDASGAGATSSEPASESLAAEALDYLRENARALVRVHTVAIRAGIDGIHHESMLEQVASEDYPRSAVVAAIAILQGISPWPIGEFKGRRTAVVYQDRRNGPLVYSARRSPLKDEVDAHGRLTPVATTWAFADDPKRTRQHTEAPDVPKGRRLIADLEREGYEVDLDRGAITVSPHWRVTAGQRADLEVNALHIRHALWSDRPVPDTMFDRWRHAGPIKLADKLAEP